MSELESTQIKKSFGSPWDFRVNAEKINHCGGGSHVGNNVSEGNEGTGW